ncbi:MAG: formimidoylglutamase, partial [Fimbriimonas sp.]|nr:formimidoylglutamase [Fimbriimonas sp.]
QGRIGAAEGPSFIRKFLSNLPANDGLDLFDAGDIACTHGRLEEAQEAYAVRAAELLNRGQFVIGLGGGHEIAWASASAIFKSKGPGKLGVLNLDAHFDMRKSEQANSGTSFLRLLEEADKIGVQAEYRVCGISEAANTKALFARARENGVEWRTDDELTIQHLPDRLSELGRWFQTLDALYLTICLDVLPSWEAPGVSAPAARGVSIEVLEPIVELASRCRKLLMADVAELCPRLDIDNRTARVASRLIWRIAQSRLESWPR